MRTLAKVFIVCVLVATLMPLFSLAAFADQADIRIGVVGMVSPFSGIRQPTSTDDLFLSIACDSLYSINKPDGRISPLLAESWPVFDEAKKTVSVRINHAAGTSSNAVVSADKVVEALIARIPGSSGIAIRSDAASRSILFTFRDDISAFWNLFAFAPVWTSGVDGTIAGAGSPPYRIASFTEGSVRLEASAADGPAITITGFPDEKSMLDAFTSGNIDYARTALTKAAASIKGLSWQSEAPNVISLVFNSKSATFFDISARAIASSLLDIPYLVLRASNGNATAARGIYFDSRAPEDTSAGTGLLAGRKLSILVDSTDRSSLEMLCALLIESWWEKGGAIVSVTVPKTDSELSALMNTGSYDALVSSIWLQPAFMGLYKSGLGSEIGASSWGGWNGNERLEAIKALRSPKSYEHLSEAARKLEAMMLDSFSVLPLIRPIISELYRPSVLEHISQSPGRPLLDSLRDLADSRSN